MPADTLDTPATTAAAAETPAEEVDASCDLLEQPGAAAAPRAAKKQKTAASGTAAVKAVKAVDPAIILQRRDAVQQRVLKLESKLAKDRALLAKYSLPYPPSSSAAVGASGDEESDDPQTNPTKTTDA